MKKLLPLAALAVIAFALPAFAEQPAVPEGVIVLDKTGNKVVNFNHSTHAAVECAECHHPVEGVETFKPCATAGCHDAMGTKEKGTNSYYRIMHERKGTEYQSCVACHFETAGTDAAKKKELTSCVGSACHPKK